MASRKASQNDRVLKYMKDFGSINPLQALGDLGVMRLASRISDLKDDGWLITKRMVKGVNRWGEKISYAEYKLFELDGETDEVRAIHLTES